jgi:hypothetical protein
MIDVTLHARASRADSKLSTPTAKAASPSRGTVPRLSASMTSA